jgi:ParB family transcriptional regulator, chromosome partitioning protein
MAEYQAEQERKEEERKQEYERQQKQYEVEQTRRGRGGILRWRIAG